MKMLMEIDTVKTRMQDASRALKVWCVSVYYNTEASVLVIYYRYKLKC